jgi:hypothetical protein
VISDAVADDEKSTIKKPKTTSWLKGKKKKEASLVITAMRPYSLHFHSATVASERGKLFLLLRSGRATTLHRRAGACEMFDSNVTGAQIAHGLYLHY